MSPQQRSAFPSVRSLHRVADALDGQVSPGRMRQLRMTLGMLDRALDAGALTPNSGRVVKTLLNPVNVDTFLELAATGALREDPERAGRPLADASMRILRDCLAILGEEAGYAVVLPRMWQQPPKATVAAGQRAVLFRELVALAGRGPLEREGTSIRFEDRTRLLAMVAVVLDCGARSGELTRMRLDDLTDDVGVVVVRRRPQNGTDVPVAEVAARAHVAPSTVSRVLNGTGAASDQVVRAVLAAVDAVGEGGPAVERYRLREGTRVAVRNWLRIREQKVAPLTGARTALWVTLVAAKHGPPGLPLSERGLQHAYERGVAALNFLMAGQFGWEPLPTRLEQLRRATDVTPVPVD